MLTLDIDQMNTFTFDKPVTEQCCGKNSVLSANALKNYRSASLSVQAKLNSGKSSWERTGLPKVGEKALSKRQAKEGRQKHQVLCPEDLYNCGMGEGVKY